VCLRCPRRSGLPGGNRAVRQAAGTFAPTFKSTVPPSTVSRLTEPPLAVRSRRALGRVADELARGDLQAREVVRAGHAHRPAPLFCTVVLRPS